MEFLWDSHGISIYGISSWVQKDFLFGLLIKENELKTNVNECDILTYP